MQIYDELQDLDINELLESNLKLDDMTSVYSGDSEKVFEGADLAISLLCEYDLDIAEKLFVRNGIKDCFGKDIPKNNFKSLDIFVEKTIDNIGVKFFWQEYSSFIKEYIKLKIEQPGFDILMGNMVNEFIQEINCKECYNDKLDLSSLKEKYKLECGSKELALNQMQAFLEKYKKKPITKDNEEEFSKFLKNIGMLKLNSEQFILPQECIDFLIVQAVRKDSIVNQESEKYLPVLETAIIDFTRLDYIDKTNENEVDEIYAVRDYLGKSSTSGQMEWHGMTFIKRELIRKLFDCNFEIIEVVYHENRHVEQNMKIKKIPETFVDHQISKERFIEKFLSYYYETNYIYEYSEIDAREISAQLTANYLEKIAYGKIIDDALDNMGNSIKEMIMEQIFTNEKNKIKEYHNYEKANEKVAENGNQEECVSDIVENVLQNRDPKDLKNYYSCHPALQIEFDDNGKRKKFNSLIDTIRTGKYNYQMMSQIITASNTISDVNLSDGSVFAVLDNLLSWSKDLENKEDLKDEHEAVRAIVADNFPLLFSGIRDELRKSKKSKQLNIDLLKIIEYMEKLKIVQNTKADNPLKWGLLRMEYNKARYNIDDIFRELEAFSIPLQVFDEGNVGGSKLSRDVYSETVKLERAVNYRIQMAVRNSSTDLKYSLQDDENNFFKNNPEIQEKQ